MIDTDLPVPESPVVPIAWQGDALDGTLRLLDQTRLPDEEVHTDHRTAEGVVDDIRRLAVRGAPAIGISGAYALVLGAREILERDPGCDRAAFLRRFESVAAQVGQARPTAVNLPAAVERSVARAHTAEGGPARITEELLRAARELDAYEKDACARIGRAGAAWLRGRRRLLTHCNAGALVSTGIGTALAPIYVLHAAGEAVHVWVDETRPLLQGLRLTAYELARAGIPHAVLVDGASAGLMARGEVDAVIVGADRVCANGDVVNKIGTYAAALAAHRHGVPFVVAAPLSTLDPETPSGSDVPIEERPADAALYLRATTGRRQPPAYAPAFDATPAALVSALVTEAGILTKPCEHSLRPLLLRGPGLQAGSDAGR